MQLTFNHAFAGACLVLAGGIFFIGPQPDPEFTFAQGRGRVTPEGGIVSSFNDRGRPCTLELNPTEDSVTQTCALSSGNAAAYSYGQRTLTSLSAREWDSLTEITDPACEAAGKRGGYNKVCDLNPRSLRNLPGHGLI